MESPPPAARYFDYAAWLDSAHQDVGCLLDQFPADRMSVRPRLSIIIA